MIPPWVVGAPVWAYGDCAGTIMAVRRDPHEYMPGVWAQVVWADGFVCWTSADSLDAVDVSLS